MSKKNITTINGEELPISKAKKFPNGYYKIGDIKIKNSGDCYKINDKFYRFETGQIIFNETTQEYQILSNDVILGLIENNQFGYFNRNQEDKIQILLENGQNSFAKNEETVKKNLNYREQISTGNYVHISRLTASQFVKILPPKNEYKTSLPYDSNGITQKYSDIYNYLYDSKINTYSYKLGEWLNKLTFGLEFETTAGFVPERITKKLGLIPLRDGSIPGLEYVTVPFSGPKGIQTIVDICKELEKRTQFNNSCALHLHIGGISRTPEFILAFLKVSSWIQNDIFTLFPLYKKYNMGIKNKNYSKPYDLFEIFSKLDPVINSSNINKNFDVLFSFLTSNKAKFKDYNNDLNQVLVHPLDPGANQKWNIRTRYFLHNFIPLIFGNKQTIEFRIHTPTFDNYRILMFLLFNSVLIKITEKYQKSILEDVNFFDKITNNGESNSNLFNLIYFYKNQEALSSEVRTMLSSLTNYFQTRKNATEKLTRDGKITFEDKDIKFYSEIDFDRNRNITYQKSNIQLQPELPNVEPEPLQEVVNVASKKPIFSKSLVEQFKEIQSQYDPYSWTDSYETFSGSINTINTKK
ncbi:MAG TPA: hypothetical protein PK507_05005 [bacterium]|nr:hypothetical protein [bacterium]